MLDSILVAAIIASPVMVLASLGGLIHHTTGVVNIALEGQILVGAFTAMIVADKTDSVLLGYAVAALAGGIVGFLTTMVITRLNGNEIIVGLGANTLVLGLIGFILGAWFASSGTYRPDDLPESPEIGFGFLADVPVLGPLLGSHDVVVWLTPAVVMLVAWVMRSTRVGLRARSIGEDPRTAINLGIRVANYREAAGGVAGLACAIGGAHLALVTSGIFNVNMTAGRGFIALAAVYFGRGRVGLTVFPALLFVIAEAAQRRLQTGGLDVPTQLVQTLPYAVVIAALVIPALQRKPQLPTEVA